MADARGDLRQRGRVPARNDGGLSGVCMPYHAQFWRARREIKAAQMRIAIAPCGKSHIDAVFGKDLIRLGGFIDARGRVIV